MPLEDIIECATVGYDMPVKMPFLTEYTMEERRTGTAGFAVHAVISAHHRFHAGIYEVFESVEISFAQIFFIYDRIEGMAVGFGAAMNSVVFCAGRSF